MHSIILLVLLLVLLVISALFSCSETSLFSLSQMRVKDFGKSELLRERIVQKLLSHPRDLLVTILSVNVIVNILVQNVFSNLVDDNAGWLKTVGIPLFLTLIFGELIPKTIGLARNDKIAPKIAPLLDFLSDRIGPMRRIMTRVGGFLSEKIFFFLRKAPEISIRELEHALGELRASGAFDLDEARLIQGYLRLEESVVQDHMRVRGDVLFYNIKDPISKLAALHVDQKVSRVPVCDGDLENVMGIMTAEIFFQNRELILKNGVQQFLKAPFFVPESMEARLLMSQFRNKQEEFAFVVEEHGSICGIITEEDLLEVIVGEINDSRDEKELYTLSGRDVAICSGKLELATFQDIFGVRFESRGVVTLGGFLTKNYGIIPSVGVKITFAGFTFTILDATDKQVGRVHVLRHPQKGEKR